MLPPTCGPRILWLRTQHNQTQQEVATIAGASQSAVGRWERGETFPDARELLRLSNHYNRTADWIIGRSDDPSGVQPGSWLIDQDLVDQLRTNTVPEDVDLRSEGWYVAIPTRPRIVTSAEFQVMLAELQPKIEQVLRHRRRRKP